MWFATVSNITEYHGSATVLDSQINGTISYNPPVIKVQEDELLTVNIRHGLLLATCRPGDNTTKEATKTLFDAITSFQAFPIGVINIFRLFP